jgi:hypothetical protein
MAKDSVNIIPLTSVDSATISAITWVPINTAGLPFGCFRVWITNNSTVDVTVSDNAGVNAKLFVPHGTTVYLDGQNNAGPMNMKTYYSRGKTFYVQGTAGTGLIYLSGLYQNV